MIARELTGRDNSLFAALRDRFPRTTDFAFGGFSFRPNQTKRDGRYSDETLSTRIAVDPQMLRRKGRDGRAARPLEKTFPINPIFQIND